MTQPSIKECPNAYAAPSQLRLAPDLALIKGYQSYTALPFSVVPDANDRNLSRKHALLAPHFTASLLENRTVVDLGCNNAFFALWAMHLGASLATAVDMDPQCNTLVNRVAASLNYERVRFVSANIQEYNQPADIVLALALVHWVYSCTADFGSLDAVIAWLASLTRHALIVEWIAPQDSAIANFRHTDFNPAARRQPYTYSAFRAALHRHFPRVVPLGHVNDTRSLFLAFKSAGEIDLSGPLPILHDRSSILSSRFLASAGQLQFWSCVYDLGNSILKQSTFDLAAREALFLNALTGPHFPRVLNSAATPAFSTLQIEKIIPSPAHEITASPRAAKKFLDACFDILQQLADLHITHRDIRPDNVLIRGGLPVLLDFGWAIAPQHPYYTPDPFLGQPPNIDLIGMAGVLQNILQPTFPTLAPILTAMANPNPRLAQTHLPTLRRQLTEAITTNDQ